MRLFVLGLAGSAQGQGESKKKTSRTLWGRGLFMQYNYARFMSRSYMSDPSALALCRKLA